MMTTCTPVWLGKKLGSLGLSLLLVCGSAKASEETVVVEGDKREPEAQNTSVTSTVVEIDDGFSKSADVASVVARSPGTHVRRLGGLGSWSGVSIRGSTFRQVMIAVDGLPLNPDGVGAIDLSTLPLSAFGSVEVYRGVVPLRFGEAPLGGVVDLRTRTVEQRGYAADLSVGSWGTGRLRATGFTRGSIGKRELRWLGSMDLLTTRGRYPYFSDNNTPFNAADDAIKIRENQEKLQWSGHTRADLSTGQTRWTIQNTALVRREGLPGPVTRPATDSKLHSQRNVLMLAADRSSPEHRIQARIWHMYRGEQYFDPAGELGVGGQVQQDQVHGMGASLRAIVPWSSVTQTSFGVQGRWEQLVRKESGEGATLQTRRAVIAAQLGNPVHLLQERLSLLPVVKTTVGKGMSVDVDEEVPVQWDVAPQLGVSYRVSSAMRLWMSLGRAYRLPDLWELFGDRGNVKGNPDLLPESGWRGDVGWALSSKPEGDVSINTGLVVFASRDMNRITYVQNATSTMVPVNFAHSRAYGLEFQFSAQLFDLVEVQGQATWTRTENLDARESLSGNRLPRVPELAGNSSTTFRFSDATSAGYQFDFATLNYWDATNGFRSAPRMIQSAWVRLHPKRHPVSLELSVLNLANIRTETVSLDPLQPELGKGVKPVMDFSGYPLPGRTWMLTLSWTGSEK